MGKGFSIDDIPSFEELKKPSASNFRLAINDKWMRIEATDFAIHKKGDMLLVQWQGSSSSQDMQDWKDDFKFWPKTDKAYGKILVHSGFLKQYMAARTVVMDAAYDADIKKIFSQGYSLGAANTQLYIQDLVHHFGATKEIYGVGYEPPRPWVINETVKKEMADHMTLVYSLADPVIHAPPALPPFNFRAYGKKVLVGHLLDLWPVQHLEDQVEKNLLEKFGH